MKRVVLTITIITLACLYGRSQNSKNVATPPPDSLYHWSVVVKTGMHYFRTSTMDITEKNNTNGYSVGGEVEYTFNPLFGIGLDVTLNRYNRAFQMEGKKVGSWKSYTFDFLGFGNMNLSNLLFKERKNQKFNLYVNAGFGYYFRHYSVHSSYDMTPYETSKFRGEILLTGGPSFDYNFSKKCSLYGSFFYHYYFNQRISGMYDTNYTLVKNNKSFEADDAWIASIGLRFKLGKDLKRHVRNLSMAQYYPTVVAAPVMVKPDNAGNDELKQQVNELQGKVKQLSQNVQRISDIQEKMIREAFKNVEFDFDKSTIREVSVSELQKAARILITNQTWKTILLTGHTDYLGGEHYNLKLSKDRVQAVKDFLVTEGVPAEKIDVKAYGKSRPVDTNSTADGRQRNRRVEIQINY